MLRALHKSALSPTGNMQTGDRRRQKFGWNRENQKLEKVLASKLVPLTWTVSTKSLHL
jgi:hypothetical protein